MNSRMLPCVTTYTVTHIKTLPAPTVKKLLREAGHNFSTVAQRRAKRPSLVSRVVRKKTTSTPVWEDVVWALNNPREQAS